VVVTARYRPRTGSQDLEGRSDHLIVIPILFVGSFYKVFFFLLWRCDLMFLYTTARGLLLSSVSVDINTFLCLCHTHLLTYLLFHYDIL